MRIAAETSATAERDDEAAQADFTVRNLVEAARIIVREADRTDTWEAATPSAAVATAPPDSQGPSPQPVPRSSEEGDDKLAGGIVQMLALLTLLIAVLYVLGSGAGRIAVATFWAILSVALQAMALTFFTIQRNK